MRITRIGAMLCTLAVSLAGCSRSDDQPKASPMPSPSSTRDAAMPAAPLAGTAWLVEAIAQHSVLDNSRLELRFDTAGRASGATGLNNFTGSATISGDSIKFGPVASTRRAGPEALMEQERLFLVALGSAATWKIDDTGQLQLRDAAGNTLLRLSPMPADQAEKSGSPASER